MNMLPNPPKFFARSSLRHVLWQIQSLDVTLEVTSRILGQAKTPETKSKAREQINTLLDHRLELMAQRDSLAGKAEAAA